MTATATTIPRSPAVILLVEDDQGDQVLTQEAFRTMRVSYDLRIATDGKEALDYLYRRGRFHTEQEAPRPDLILLDLNMPRVSGQQVAEQIHSDPDLRNIPIVVLTTSRRKEDVMRTYSRGVMTFITKPLGFDQFIAALRELEQFLRFLVTLKNVRARARMSDRQMVRLLRRQQALEKMTDLLFNQHMRRIEDLLSDEPNVEPDEKEEYPDDQDRESILRLAKEILKGLPERPIPTAGSRGGPSDPDSLINLERSLVSPAQAKEGSEKGSKHPRRSKRA